MFSPPVLREGQVPNRPKPVGLCERLDRRPVKALKSHLEKLLGGVCFLIFAALTLVVLWQVVSRYALASPSSASEELARILLMWLGLLGASYAHLKDQHIAIELFPQSLTKMRKRTVVLLCQIFAVVLLFGGLNLCRITFELEQTTPVLGWPVGLIYSVLPLSGLLLSVANYYKLQETP